MANEVRKVIAISESGERKVFDSMNEAARELRSTYQQVQISILRGGTCNGWRVYDTPENIRKRIEALEEQIKMLEGM